MKILLLETSSECASIAVIEGDKLIFEQKLPSGPELSKTLGAEVEKLLKQYPPPYTHIVTGIGPGSFTGIRVGASMASALSFGWQIPLFTVSSLTGFGPGVVAIDGRMGGIYVQIDAEGPQLLSLEAAAEFLSKQPFIASPHPGKIVARLPDLKVEKRPLDPLRLVQYAAPGSYPFKINY
jgi:tRNA threonylcarbamoyl adenosine modification protein YeaZ